MGISSQNIEQTDLIELMKSLETRIHRIESHLDIIPIKDKVPTGTQPNSGSNEGVDPESENLEFRIGEYWFAKIGIAVLVIGLAFLLTLPYDGLPVLIPNVFGFILALTMFVFSYRFQGKQDYIARYLWGGALLLFYFAAMRLHFFNDMAVVENRLFTTLLLLAIGALGIVGAAYKKSVYLVALGLFIGYATALISEQAYTIFGLITILSLLAVYFHRKNHWFFLMPFSILMAYLTHFIWFINNPVMGNELALLDTPWINLIFILVYFVIFAYGNFPLNSDDGENNLLIINAFLNGAGAYALFLLISASRFQESLTMDQILASVVLLVAAAITWRNFRSKYATFFYAMLGYAALSVAIFVSSASPDYYIWLSWQSLIVVTTAIWFRSKFIIVANFLIYLLIFLAYLAGGGSVGLVSLSFGFVALFSARILNWQKHRLELKTESMRNAYLVAAFIIFPYALYHMIPDSYISLSWVGVTLLYYVLGRVLDNRKYRWMALLTLGLTVLRVFVIDIAYLDAVYRTATFLVLAAALLVVSWVYARMRSAKKQKEQIV